jgi:protein-S-isoprenylcysteine O-methyltransferase Ste14
MAMNDTARAGLVLRNLLFTAVVPGLGGVYGPWLILTHRSASPTPVAWQAVIVIAIGLVLYFWCQWVFATVGRGTPGIWDAPRRLVEAGPYRWVRNPIYIAAEVIVLGEAWLFLSIDLLVYAGVLAVAFHALVAAYEEPRLHARFGEEYDDYRRRVHRWIPRLPVAR